MQKSENIDALCASLVKAQLKMKNPPLDSENPFFKNQYASLCGVRDTVTPILAEQGLAVTQLLSHEPDGIVCETVLVHQSGQWLSSAFYMPATKKDAQGYGSAITYARRYALMAICGVVGDVDDDANAATHKPTKEAITPTAGAWEALTEKQRHQLTDLALVVKGHLKDGNMEVAITAIDEAHLDADSKVALWSRFDSKERSAMTKHREGKK